MLKFHYRQVQRDVYIYDVLYTSWPKISFRESESSSLSRECKFRFTCARHLLFFRDLASVKQKKEERKASHGYTYYNPFVINWPCVTRIHYIIYSNARLLYFNVHFKRALLVFFCAHLLPHFFNFAQRKVWECIHMPPKFCLILLSV